MRRVGRLGLALAPALLVACAGLSGLTGGPGASDAGGDDAGADTAAADTAVAPGDDGGADATTPADTSTAPDVQPPDDAPVSAFAYRRRVSIVNGSTSDAPAGMTIHVPVDSSILPGLVGKVRGDYADVRVIGDGAIGERHRILDLPTDVAPVGIDFSLAKPIAGGATSTDYAIYYGDPAATAPPQDGTKVFAVYDDFATTIAQTWMKNDGPQVVGGALVLRAGRQDALTTVAAADGVPIVSAVEASIKVQNPQSAGQQLGTDTFWYWFGYQHQGDFTASDPWIIWVARGAGTVQAEQENPGACTNNCAGAPLGQSTAYRYYMVARDPTETRFTLDSTLYYTAQGTNDTDYSVMVRNYALTSDLNVDWIRARVRVTPDPTVTLGPEEKLH